MSIVKFTLADMAAKPLELGEIEAMLTGPNILRLGVVDERDGSPLVHPVWFYYENDIIFIATDTDGVKARSLRRNPNAYFVIDTDEGPPRGIRGKGTVTVSDDHRYAIQITKKCAVKYLGTTESKTAKKIIEMGRSSSVVEISPRYIATWKF